MRNYRDFWYRPDYGYILYEKETNELIGKFTYDGSNTMKIFDSQNYNGNYVKGD